MKSNKFDKILKDFEPLSEIEKMDKVNGGYRPPITAAYAVVAPILQYFLRILNK